MRALLLIALLATLGCRAYTCRDESGVVVFEGNGCSQHRLGGTLSCHTRCEDVPGGRTCSKGRTSFQFNPAPGTTCVEVPS